jgi:hypothetical protein
MRDSKKELIEAIAKLTETCNAQRAKLDKVMEETQLEIELASFARTIAPVVERIGTTIVHPNLATSFRAVCLIDNLFVTEDGIYYAIEKSKENGHFITAASIIPVTETDVANAYKEKSVEILAGKFIELAQKSFSDLKKAEQLAIKLSPFLKALNAAIAEHAKPIAEAV